MGTAAPPLFRRVARAAAAAGRRRMAAGTYLTHSYGSPCIYACDDVRCQYNFYRVVWRTGSGNFLLAHYC